jgi:membrane-associated phospholipid phosphatase
MLQTLESFLFGHEAIVWVQRAIGYGWDLPFRIVSLLGVSWGVIFAVGLAFWLWDRGTAYSLIGIVVVEALVSIGLNGIFSVPRPSHPEIVAYEQISADSFPSGHLLTTLVIWGWLYLRARVPLLVSALVVFAMAVARMYLGVHYLGDVVGALAFGFVILLLYQRAYPAISRWLEEKPQSVFVALGAASVIAALAAPTLVYPENPFIWTAAGVMFAGPIAIALERRYVAYRPGERERPRRITLLIGSLGIGLFLIPFVATAESAVVIGGLSTAGATLWAWWGAPSAGTQAGKEGG